MTVLLRIYCFHASEPDSRPPPVSFSPRNAPPISAPLGSNVYVNNTTIGTYCDVRFPLLRTLSVNIRNLNLGNCVRIFIASSKSEYFRTYKMVANVSVLIKSHCSVASTIAVLLNNLQQLHHHGLCSLLLLPALMLLHSINRLLGL